jgi:hypothetical protein
MTGRQRLRYEPDRRHQVGGIDANLLFIREVSRDYEKAESELFVDTRI